MRIKTKLESIEAIKKLELNQFPEIFLNGLDEQIIRSFLEETKVEWYVVRDKTTVASPLAKGVRFDEVIDYCKEININKFTVGVSFRNYQKYQLCVGEVHIHDSTIDYIISNNPSYSPRDMKKDPDYNETTDIFDKKLRRIKGLEEIMDYAFEHNLLDVIIEFSIFDCPVGIKNERVVIGELRTDY